MDILKTIRPAVRDLSPYSLKRAKARIKLNQNENPWEAPPAIKQEVLRRIASLTWSRYPEFVPQELRQRLVEHTGWSADGIVPGNGSNEIIQALLMVTLGQGKRVLVNEPTFALYRQLATVLGAEVITVPLTPALSYDSEKILETLERSDPDVLIMCSPNNPTGCAISSAELASILEAARGLVVLDEAYIEFSGESALPLMRQYSNLVILRTFSKAMALAGLRVGYLLAIPALAREVSKAVLPYNLNIISQTAAEVSLEMYNTHLKPLIQRICAERDRLFAEIGRIPGLKPAPSRANFMVIKSSIPPTQVFDELLERDILIRDVSSYPRLQDYFRICVGKPEENDELLRALNEIESGHSKREPS